MDGGHTKSSGTILDIACDGPKGDRHGRRPKQKNNACLLHFRRHGMLPVLPDHSPADMASPGAFPGTGPHSEGSFSWCGR